MYLTRPDTDNSNGIPQGSLWDVGSHPRILLQIEGPTEANKYTESVPLHM